MPKFTNHAEMVATLGKPGEDIIKTLTPFKAHIWHMSSCIMGEVAELIDAVYLEGHDGEPVEEFGDIEFYIESLRAPLNISRQETLENKFDVYGDGARLIKYAGDLFDVIKKNIIYNKELDIKKVIKALTGIESYLEYIREGCSLTYEQTIQANLDKLNVRYADGYSDKAAQERADKVA